MRMENFIESQYRELISNSSINTEYIDLYSSFDQPKLREILSTLHYDLVSLFRTMNERLPTGEYGSHFWADPSRKLITTIEIALNVLNTLKNTKDDFQIDEYYLKIIYVCRDFLKKGGGSPIPPNMNKIELYYKLPIFIPSNVVSIKSAQSIFSLPLKQIGGGSYATVFKYKDQFYNKCFALKRAKKDLSEKELERFKREYEEMQEFSSPYILEVYCYNDAQNEYIMEYMDDTLENYIVKHNTSLLMPQRKSIVQQILKAFAYIHSKERLHRDISPKNVLLKEYEDVLVVKIADFGLVKLPDSVLTTAATEFKGFFNDPSLILDGFSTYNILHETFALTRIVYFVMTGKTNTDIINDPLLKAFVTQGLNADKSKRFHGVDEMMQSFKKLGN